MRIRVLLLNSERKSLMIPVHSYLFQTWFLKSIEQGLPGVFAGLKRFLMSITNESRVFGVSPVSQKKWFQLFCILFHTSALCLVALKNEIQSTCNLSF